MVCMIPEDFDLKNFLSVRESAGIFEDKEIKLKKLELAADSISSSPITFLTGLNKKEINYFTKILEELHLVMDQKTDYEINIEISSFVNSKHDMHNQSIFLAINIFHVTKLKDYEKVVERMIALEDYKVAEEVLQNFKASGVFA